MFTSVEQKWMYPLTLINSDLSTFNIILRFDVPFNKYYVFHVFSIGISDVQDTLKKYLEDKR